MRSTSINNNRRSCGSQWCVCQSVEVPTEHRDVFLGPALLVGELHDAVGERLVDILRDAVVERLHERTYRSDERRQGGQNRSPGLRSVALVIRRERVPRGLGFHRGNGVLQGVSDVFLTFFGHGPSYPYSSSSWSSSIIRNGRCSALARCGATGFGIGGGFFGNAPTILETSLPRATSPREARFS